MIEHYGNREAMSEEEEMEQLRKQREASRIHPPGMRQALVGGNESGLQNTAGMSEKAPAPHVEIFNAVSEIDSALDRLSNLISEIRGEPLDLPEEAAGCEARNICVQEVLAATPGAIRMRTERLYSLISALRDSLFL